MADGTLWSVQVVEVFFAVDFPVLLHEALIGQVLVAVDADEMLRMPVAAYGGDERAPGEEDFTVIIL